MADLLTVASDSLSHVNTLGTRTEEMVARIAAARSAFETEMKQLQTDFAGTTDPTQGVLTRMGGFKDKVTAGAASTISQLDSWDRDLQDAAKRLQTEHRDARERLSKLRGQFKTMDADLEKLQGEVKTALQASQDRCQALFSDLAKSIDQAEQSLLQDFVVHVKGLQARVDQRKSLMHENVATRIIPHLQGQADNLSSRLQQATDQVTSLLQGGHHQTRDAVATHMDAFDKGTSVDFRGSRGAVADGARDRSASLNKVAAAQQQTLAQVQGRVAQLSTDFKQAAQQAHNHYQAVADVPGQLQKIIDAAHSG